MHHHPHDQERALNLSILNVSGPGELLSSPEGIETDVGDFDDFESKPGNISNSVTSSTKTSDENFVIFIDIVERTVKRDESRNFLSVLNQLDSDSLSHGRVRLLGFDTNLFKNNTLGMRSSSKRVSLQRGEQVTLLVINIGPSVSLSVNSVLSSATNSTGLCHSALESTCLIYRVVR